MAKEMIAKENPVMDALKKLKDEEVELLSKLKPVQEAIAALEKIVDKSVRKAKPASSKDQSGETSNAEERVEEVAEVE